MEIDCWFPNITDILKVEIFEDVTVWHNKGAKEIDDLLHG